MNGYIDIFRHTVFDSVGSGLQMNRQDFRFKLHLYDFIDR